LLFIVFDIELAFLLPWLHTLYLLGSVGYWIMILFLLLLSLGFYYEWNTGAMDWAGMEFTFKHKGN
jgi:NADH-quinone oxidoreductase subunit A